MNFSQLKALLFQWWQIQNLDVSKRFRGSTIGLAGCGMGLKIKAGCGILKILVAGYGMKLSLRDRDSFLFIGGMWDIYLRAGCRMT